MVPPDEAQCLRSDDAVVSKVGPARVQRALLDLRIGPRRGQRFFEVPPEFRGTGARVHAAKGAGRPLDGLAVFVVMD